MIKIVSGWSNPGGSTTAHINLCNLFNSNGMDCTFYGPHEFHKKFCKSDSLKNLLLSPNDTLIAHFVNPDPYFKNAGKLIYSCHEKDIKPVKSFDYKMYDVIHYVSQPQKEWHGVKHPSFICGNVLDNLKPNEKKQRAAAVIGSIDHNKQTHKSIQRAIADGHDTIYLFGVVTDQSYYTHYVSPLVKTTDKYKVKLMGFAGNKQGMYDLISDVYQDSISECLSYVKQECALTKTNYHGSSATSFEYDVYDNQKILNMWKEYV